MPEYKLNPLTPRQTGTRAAKDYKESEHTEELSGELLNFVAPKQYYGYDSGGRSSRSIKTSDDYKEGGTASSRADGIAARGKTRGKIV